GEKFPMDNWDVRQRLDAELLRNVYFHSQTILAVKRANAIFPIIEPILKEEGVPADLKYLAVAESALSNAISPAGARGVWQFMKDAAAGYNLEVNTEVDERYHLEKATRAACKYMKKEKERLGSWILAAAAYNGGPGRIAEEMAKQRAKSFFDLNLAADETMRYPFRIVAIKEVMENPAEYDYEIEKDHLYPPLSEYRTVEVKGPVPSWGDFAQENNTSYRMLKLYNPWLIDGKLTNKEGKTYRIRLPK
ncbi:MAG: lytic transglycosylase domain-containing protein, partial [Saprospiraceae bacterium]|nr:lytic transglycosylase domain-containing protein [Saprospiraceae bacterium]